ncbi:hypothetical protein EMPS_11425 [Entomortierella parvispora]|uniref:Uncharacterized protein n=1 Tax=Entomortierella parvispora TaxID=205924 RepID=A0A9P3HLV2_9FUNG|nr:hypothetical protein EMPS_11425 [Entomortierella parvispora]
MVKATFALLVASMAMLLSSTVESAPIELSSTGKTIALISASEYCLLLPPNKGGNIADSEDSAISFCNKAISTAPNAKTLPSGFIKSAHFVHNTSKDYVQITGKIDRSKYDLSAGDGGGQYDLNAPHGSACAGYSSFVQFVEPDVQIYCLRCCKNKSDCPTNRSTDGCEAVLGGDYS